MNDDYTKILIPMIRKVMPTVIAQEIVGVQPMGMVHKTTTPWEYLENWAWSDRGPDETLQKLNERMQNRWPGPYTIVQKEVRDPDRFHKVIKYDFQFDPPEAETMFRIKYS